MTVQRQSHGHLCPGHSVRRHRYDLDPNFKEAKEERGLRMLTHLAEFNPVTLRPLRCVTTPPPGTESKDLFPHLSTLFSVSYKEKHSDSLGPIES